MGGFGVPCSRFGNYHDHFGLQQEFRLVFRLKKGPDKLARTGAPGYDHGAAVRVSSSAGQACIDERDCNERVV